MKLSQEMKKLLDDTLLSIAESVTVTAEKLVDSPDVAELVEKHGKAQTICALATQMLVNLCATCPAVDPEHFVQEFQRAYVLNQIKNLGGATQN